MIILILGLPGTGKTTFAEALAKEIGAKHFNSDKTRIVLGKTGQYDTATKSSIYTHMLGEVESLLIKHGIVIVDATFYQEKLRAPFQRLASSLGIPIKYIQIKSDPAIVASRMKTKRKYSEADFEVYKHIKNQYEPLDKAHLTLWSDQLSLETMVEKAKDFLLL